MVNKPGSGVANMQIAITGVKLQKRSDLVPGAFGVLPFGRMINRSRTPMVKLGDAAVEIELLDSSTGKRFAVAIDPAILVHGKGKPDLESLSEDFKLYASRMRQHLDDFLSK